MATVEIEVYDKQVNRLFSKLLNKTRNLRPVFRSIAEEVYNSVMENFRAESDPKGNKWRALAVRTIRERLYKHPGTPIHILHETGNLERSIHTKATNNYAMVGTSVEYSRAMQFGDANKRIPARPYLGVKNRDWENIKDIVKDYITR